MNKVTNYWEFLGEYTDASIYHNKKIILFIDTIPYCKIIDNVKKYFNPYTHCELIKTKDDIYIFIQIESWFVISNVIQLLAINKDIVDLLDYVLAYDVGLLKLNAIKCIRFLPYAKYFWIQPPSSIKNIFLEHYNVKDKYDYPVDRKFNITYAMGHKNYLPGHILRHELWNRQNEIIIPKTFFYCGNHTGMKINSDNMPIGHKVDKTNMFKNSMFAITLENNKSVNYFTEKFIECIVSKTVPIYWGCPNINDFFDMNGIITFNTIDELINLINKLTPNDYFNRLKYVEINYNKWLQLPSFSEQIINVINKIQ